MDGGRVLYASHCGVHVLFLEGDVHYTLTPSLRRFVEGLFEVSPVGGFVIDLRGAVSIDSTNLGELARIALRMQKRRGPRVILVSDRQDINEILESMGFDEIFDIVEGGAPPDAAWAVPQIDATPDELAKIMLEAHRTLMELNERNRLEFRDVVEMLESELATA